ncbi:MAG: hypothetical protein IE889_06375 [Campylobacterales bacterium]|nr:hypothetical protein [Campylobacterales bacterium]
MKNIIAVLLVMIFFSGCSGKNLAWGFWSDDWDNETVAYQPMKLQDILYVDSVVLDEGQEVDVN